MLITITAVKLQMFGGETCHVHVRKETTRVTETTNKNNLDIASVNFKQMSNNYYGALELALLARSLLMLYKRLGRRIYVHLFVRSCVFHI